MARSRSTHWAGILKRRAGESTDHSMLYLRKGYCWCWCACCTEGLKHPHRKCFKKISRSSTSSQEVLLCCLRQGKHCTLEQQQATMHRVYIAQAAATPLSTIMGGFAGCYIGKYTPPISSKSTAGRVMCCHSGDTA